MSGEPTRIEEIRDLRLEMVHVPLLKPVTSESKSEIARLMHQIDDEYVSSWNALYGFASGNLRHEFINKRIENVARYIDEQRRVIGDEAAMDLLFAWENKVADEAPNAPI